MDRSPVAFGAWGSRSANIILNYPLCGGAPYNMHTIVIASGLGQHAQRLCWQRQRCSEALLAEKKILFNAVGNDRGTRAPPASEAMPAEIEVICISASRDQGALELRRHRQRFSRAVPAETRYSGVLLTEMKILWSSAGRDKVNY